MSRYSEWDAPEWDDDAPTRGPTAPEKASARYIAARQAVGAAKLAAENARRWPETYPQAVEAAREARGWAREFTADEGLRAALAAAAEEAEEVARVGEVSTRAAREAARAAQAAADAEWEANRAAREEEYAAKQAARKAALRKQAKKSRQNPASRGQGWDLLLRAKA